MRASASSAGCCGEARGGRRLRWLTPSPTRRVSEMVLASVVGTSHADIDWVTRAMGEADPSPDAFERVVDRLLASPHYGERWGRHWLDVARYADTKGYVFFEERRLPLGLHLPRLRHPGVQRGPALRPFLLEQLAADQLAARRRPAAAGGAGLPDARPAVHEQPARHPRRPHRRGDARPAGADGRLRPLPRPQVRPDPDAGLLLALRRLRQLASSRRCRRCSTDPPQTRGVRRVREGAGRRASRSWPTSSRAKHAELVAAAPDARGRVPAGRPRAARPAEHRRVHAPRRRRRPEPDDDRPLAGATWSGPRKAHAPGLRPLARLRRAAGEGVRRARPPARASRRRRPADGRSTRSSRRRFADQPPQTLAEVAQRYGELLNDVEQALAGAAGERRPHGAADPAQEELRQVFHGPDSPPNVPLTPIGDLALLPDRPSQAQAAGAAQGGRAVARRPAPARRRGRWSWRTLPTPYEPRVFLRGNPNNLGERGAAAVPRRAGRREPQAVPRRQRPAGAGPGDRRAGQPADGPRDGQPRLDAPLRRRPGAHARATSACAASRRPTPSCSTTWPTAFMDDGWSIKKLHRLIMLSARLPAGERRPAGAPRGRPGEPAALADEPPPARLRGDCATRCWPSSGRLDRDGRRAAGRGHLTAPVATAADALRLHRPAEPAGPVPHLRLRQPRRHQPAARRDDGAAAGAVPDEQPVRPRRGPPRRPEVAAETDPARRVDRLYRLLYGRGPTPRRRVWAWSISRNGRRRGDLLAAWEKMRPRAVAD